MNRKLLIVCGPTATGKTNTALKLAKLFDGELLSVDSRQVYKGMDIGTGKDIPDGYDYDLSTIHFQDRSIGYYVKDNIRIWGYDLVAPFEQFSVAEYVSIMRLVLKDVWKRSRLPILVGGTGHYIESLLRPPNTVGIQTDVNLRESLASKTLLELQNKLSDLDPSRLSLMNNSDKNNPRRLIRAIEISLADKKPSSLPMRPLTPDIDISWVGLRSTWEVLDDRIDSRVKTRVEVGMEEEVKRLQTQQLDRELPALSAIGYDLYQQYLDGKLSLEDTLFRWATKEKQYARRQMTWFKVNKNITWFDIEDTGSWDAIVRHVKSWYS